MDEIAVENVGNQGRGKFPLVPGGEPQSDLVSSMPGGPGTSTAGVVDTGAEVWEKG